MRGRFITLEGGEGAGKSTQACYLADWLRVRGHKVLETREPGGCWGAEALRGLLIDPPDGTHWDPVGEALILSAARRDHLRQVIWPALDQGTWVICDRFADSTVAYQGYGHGIPLDTLETLYDLVAGPFAPDLTLILDLDPVVGLARARSRGALTRFERLDAAFHGRVRAGFLDIARRTPERCAVIAADGEEEVVTRRTLDALEASMRTWAEDEADAVSGGAV